MMRENMADQLVVDQERHSAVPTGAERLLRKRLSLVPRYAHIFSYKKRILTVLKQLRVSSRPLVLAVSSATDLARHTRATGESIGYSYPTNLEKCL